MTRSSSSATPRLSPGTARRSCLEVQPELKLLLSPTEGVAQVLLRGEELPPFDLHCPLMSLPLAFRTVTTSIPAEIPYVRAPEALVAAWRERLPQGRPRVGLAWSGRPTHNNDRNRSISLARLAPLLAADVAFVSLQRELREEDGAALRAHPNLACLGPELKTFADLAAVVALLDLVISVDTALAHLAGSLGKPAWIMLPAGPTGAGCSSATIRPGTRRRGCFANRDWAIGRASLRACVASSTRLGFKALPDYLEFGEWSILYFWSHFLQKTGVHPRVVARGQAFSGKCSSGPS